jgi:hypothetical protein
VRISPSLLLAPLLGALVLGPGCRCSDPPAEPLPSAPRVEAGPIPCPAPPDWAEQVPEEDHLLAEITYQAELDSSRKGSGMRVYDDGRVHAFEEEHFTFKDGKLQKEKVEPIWRAWGRVPAKRIEDLKALLARLDAADLTDFQGKGRKGSGKANLIGVRKPGAGLLRSCYRGKEGSGAQHEAEQLVQKLVGEAGEAAKAQASSSAFIPPAASAPPAGSR